MRRHCKGKYFLLLLLLMSPVTTFPELLTPSFSSYICQAARAIPEFAVEAAELVLEHYVVNNLWNVRHTQLVFREPGSSRLPHSAPACLRVPCTSIRFPYSSHNLVRGCGLVKLDTSMSPDTAAVSQTG